MKYQYTFDFFNTEEQAKQFCIEYNRNQTYYMRKHKPAHYTPWISRDGTEHKFIAWYYR